MSFLDSTVPFIGNISLISAVTSFIIEIFKSPNINFCLQLVYKLESRCPPGNLQTRIVKQYPCIPPFHPHPRLEQTPEDYTPRRSPSTIIKNEVMVLKEAKLFIFHLIEVHFYLFEVSEGCTGPDINAVHLMTLVYQPPDDFDEG